MASQNSLKRSTRTVAVKKLRHSTEPFFSMERYSDPGFSFKDSFTNIEGLQNPNLLDSMNFDRIQNKSVPLQQGFPELSNPIFDLDEQTSMMMGTEINKINTQMQQKTVDLQNKVMLTTANLMRGYTRYG